MCGIVGIVSPSLGADRLAKVIEGMSGVIAHRGPDGHGALARNGLALGHRRLSIIDLVSGDQPMVDDRGFAISYNGELYNYRELREQLERRGERFYTSSDTEVVLKAYVKWGPACLERFNGIFALAIAEFPRNGLFLARDRLGVKPLYYAETPDAFVFASEIKALLASDLVNRRIDLSQVPFYLRSGYFPGAETPFAGIRLLRSAHWLRVADGVLHTGCYWDPRALASETSPRRATATDEEEIRALVRAAVGMQTVADVPIGVFLSGGLDSGIVAAALSQSGHRPVRTFTVRIADAADEGPVAREVARRYDTDHQEIAISADDLRKSWTVLMDHFDTPFADFSALPAFAIGEFARRYVKVVLSGDGGDELWGGYLSYRRYVQLTQMFDNKPWRWSRTVVSKACGAAAALSGKERLAFYARLLGGERGRLYDDLRFHLSGAGLQALAGERLRPFVADPAGSWAGTSFRDLDEILRHDIQTFMVDDVLRKVDMMSMFVGLEVRVPLLDHRLVERAAEISWRDKVSTKQTKLLMRRLFRDNLPASVASGAKRGFGVPLDDWFRGPLRDVAEDVLLSSDARRRGVLVPRAVRAILDEHRTGRVRNGRTIGTLLALERWLSRHDV